ncbi:MAG: hypothetical protein ACRCZ0_05660 [Cetobacterium sp.]
MKVVGFGYAKGKSYANIEFSESNTHDKNYVKAYYNHEGITFDEGYHIDDIEELLLSKEVWDLTGVFEYNLPEDLKWIGYKATNNLIDLEKGYSLSKIRNNQRVAQYESRRKY